MRKTIGIFFVALLLFSACGKKYNCSCSTTVIYNNGLYSSYVVSNTKPMDKKLRKKDAEKVCEHEAKNINETFTNVLTNSGNQSSNGTRASTMCQLK